VSFARFDIGAIYRTAGCAAQRASNRADGTL